MGIVKIYIIQNPLQNQLEIEIYSLWQLISQRTSYAQTSRGIFFFLTSVLFHSLPFPVFMLSALALLTMGLMSQGLYRSPLNASGMGAFHTASSQETAEAERNVLSVRRLHWKATALESNKPVSNTTWQFARLFEGILSPQSTSLIAGHKQLLLFGFLFRKPFVALDWQAFPLKEGQPPLSVLSVVVSYDRIQGFRMILGILYELVKIPKTKIFGILFSCAL